MYSFQLHIYIFIVSDGFCFCHICCYCYVSCHQTGPNIVHILWDTGNDGLFLLTLFADADFIIE